MKERDYLFDELPPFEPEKGRTFGRPRRPRLWLLLALALVVLVFWPLFAGFYTDWLWFQEVGYQTVFSTTLKAKAFFGLLGGALAAALFWLNVRLALKVSEKSGRAGYTFYIGNQPVAIADAGRTLARLALPISLAVGFFVGARCWAAWETLLQWRYGAAFGETDPIFGYDIAFFFFTLPALEFIAGLLLVLVLALLAAAAVVYVGRAAVSLGAGFAAGGERVVGGFSVEPGARAHLLALVAALFLVIAWRTYLGRPELLFSASNTVAGAGYTDIHATLPLLLAEVVVAALIALVAVAGIFLGRVKFVVWGLALYGVALVAGFLYPAVVQRFSVAPNELQKETPFINYSINATRKAYNLDAVEERELAGANTLTPADIQENRRTINNIRLWDQGPLLDTFGQLQTIRTYYDFESVDNDRYQIDGETRQVMLSARELKTESLQNRNWINERLIFTHGYGLTVGPVNQVTPEGLPVLFVQDIPPKTSVESLKVDRPEIYFGELTNDHVYVKTAQQEFNYPEGESNQMTSYAGAGGVSLGTSWHRALFATRFGDMKLVLSNDITPESRVLFYRNIRQRLQKVAPFLAFDRDPYLVISEGRLFWLCDAYTTSDRYPYSQASGQINYIRNSVKAVVDAYNGGVQLYVADERDPLIQTYGRIFPGVLKPLAEMPAGLRAHLRYPEDIFRIQTRVYATYHMDQPQTFYNKEDQWEVASAEERDGQAVAMEPYYTIMKLPNEQSEEFLLMLPFVPKNKTNLAAWMVARSDDANYGKLVVYRFPKQRTVFGPRQVVNRINQDTQISSQRSLWDQRGSRVIPGSLLVIPIKESLIYIQPLYLQAETGRIPELKRVIVVAENRIAMEETLEASLARIFGSAAVPTAPPPAQPETQANAAPPQPGASPAALPPPPAASVAGAAPDLGARAKQHYDRALQAQREGDWARYGEEIKQLGAVLEELSRQKR
jgi:uncharacterized protein